MKVINNTHWRSDQLRAIISRVVNDELSAEKRARLVVTVDYTMRKRTYSSGCAVVGGRRMTVRISKHAEHVSKRDFAKVLAHECAHLRGMHHRDMPSQYHAPYHVRTTEQHALYAWAEKMPLEVKAKKPRLSSTSLREKRFNNVLALEKKWASKLKLAQTKLRKLKSKHRYYERALAADRAAKETHNVETL